MQSSADRQPRQPAPAFEHAAFPAGLGFVAGFVDIFSFTALLGLLPAHVTGNLIFLAVDLARHEYNVVMKVAALPIFAVSVAISAWLIGSERSGRHPFLPMMLLQATVLGLSLIVGLILPKPATPDDTSVIAVGTMMLFAMALQNTVMRLILNNLPPTTIMTGNITHVVAEGMRWLAGFGTTMTRAEKATLGSAAGFDRPDGLVDAALYRVSSLARRVPSLLRICRLRRHCGRSERWRLPDLPPWRRPCTQWFNRNSKGRFALDCA